jgi:hypothetical protein
MGSATLEVPVPMSKICIINIEKKMLLYWLSTYTTYITNILINIIKISFLSIGTVYRYLPVYMISLLVPVYLVPVPYR